MLDTKLHPIVVVGYENGEEEIPLCVFDTRLFVIGVVGDEMAERRQSDTLRHFGVCLTQNYF